MKTLKLNDTGKEVQELQTLLQKQGLNILVHGAFDEATKAAVVTFQRRNGLDADGIVGYRSWEILLTACHIPTERLSEADFALVAKLLDVETAALKAVQEVETGGKGGFFAPGKPAILFEGHIFWRELKKRGIHPEDHLKGNENILYPKWEKGHYIGGIREYDRVEQARKINKEAADASASWGMFQVMGFNHAACGEKSVAGFVDAMVKSEFNQLLLAGRFIHQSRQMHAALQAKDWATFAKCYNGPGYAENRYDEKLEKAYGKYAR